MNMNEHRSRDVNEDSPEDVLFYWLLMTPKDRNT